MSHYQIRRLWGDTVPILSTNLLELGLVDTKFNAALTQAAVSAFDGFTAKTTPSPSSSAKLEEYAPPGRRKRRARTSTCKTLESLAGCPTSLIDTNARVTPNDNFFEFQRTRGYRLASPSMSHCDATRQLEEEHTVNAVAHYLRRLAGDHANKRDRSGISKSIADTLQASGAGLSIDLWAAVQRGKGAYHSYHVHEGAIVSGVYYSSCPPGCAPLVLKRPGEGAANGNDELSFGTDSEEEYADEDEITIPPTEGQLVVFPPWVQHGIPLVNDEEILKAELPRVSWAFNLTGRLASIGNPWNVTRPY